MTLESIAVAGMHLLVLGLLFALAAGAIRESELWLGLCEWFGWIRHITELLFAVFIFTVVYCYQIDILGIALGIDPGRGQHSNQWQLWLGYLLTVLGITGVAVVLSRIMVLARIHDRRPQQVRECEARLPWRRAELRKTGELVWTSATTAQSVGQEGV